MLQHQEDYDGMVELVSYSSADWPDSVVASDKAKALKSH